MAKGDLEMAKLNCAEDCFPGMAISDKVHFVFDGKEIVLNWVDVWNHNYPRIVLGTMLVVELMGYSETDRVSFEIQPLDNGNKIYCMNGTYSDLSNNCYGIRGWKVRLVKKAEHLPYVEFRLGGPLVRTDGSFENYDEYLCDEQFFRLALQFYYLEHEGLKQARSNFSALSSIFNL